MSLHLALRIAGHASLLGLRSNPRRAAYLSLVVGVTVAAWLVLAALIAPFVADGSRTDTGGRIIVRNARASQQALPVKYAGRILSLVGVRDVVFLDIKLVSCAGSNTVTVNAIGGSGALMDVRRSGFNDADAIRWKNDTMGALIDRKTANNCGWRLGGGIQPADAISGEPTPLHVAGVSENDDSSGSVALAHYDYINSTSSIAGDDRVLRIDVRAIDPRDQEALASRIEKEFAHDDPPVTAYPDTLAENVIARFGKVQYLLGSVIFALLFCCGLVLTSVLAYASAERRANFALLLAMGFGRRLLWFGLLAEAALILLMGSLVGTAMGIAGLRILPTELQALFGVLHPPGWAWHWMPLWMSALAGISLVVPSLALVRTRPTDCRY